MRLIVFRPAALVDLRVAIYDYESKRTGLGREFRVEFDAAIETIHRFPELYARDDVVDPARDIRICPLKRFPYIVIYAVTESEIIVLAITHQHRDPEYWRTRNPDWTENL